MKDTPLILIVGKSGSGKDTLVEKLCCSPLLPNGANKEPKYLSQVISYTTRPRRKGKGDTHIFVKPDQVPNKSEMFAYTKYNGYEYWTTYQQVKDCDLYIIDPQGIKNIDLKRLKRKVIVVYLDVSWYKRLWRITKRNNLIYAIKRLYNDHKHFVNFNPDYTFNNDTNFTLLWNMLLIIHLIDKDYRINFKRITLP